MGRPWLREAKVKHDWNRDRISLQRDKKKLYVYFGNKTTRRVKIPHNLSKHTETFNMADTIEGTTKKNHYLEKVRILYIDEIMKKYDKKMEHELEKGPPQGEGEEST